MSDENLRFNPHTMQYEAVKKKRSRLRGILVIVLSGIAFGMLFILIGTSFIKSKDVRKKEHDLQVYKETFEEIEKQYQQNVEMLQQLELQDRRLFREIFDADPPDTVLMSSQLLQDVQNTINDEDASGVVSVVKAVYSKLSNLAYVEKVRLDFASYFITQNTSFIKSMPIRVPLPNGSYTLVSGFGKRIHPIFKTARQHNGLDFAARAGTEVLAAGDGIVQQAPKNLAGYGNIVFISHGNGIYTLYAQLLEARVQPGEKVLAGEVIGYVGSTGISIGPHLHYEVWKNMAPVDPMRYLLTLKPLEYMKMKRIASQYNQCLS
ncbi:MAG: hypothetical protein CVU11_12740 [Bacteroidetes bacterium HGW-Bacteroidetes-6]|nr:MAG: hypothetical protein CVU11_12740 [Bacteroidetes bacterium HGW-Bacteroidetes-6]